MDNSKETGTCWTGVECCLNLDADSLKKLNLPGQQLSHQFIGYGRVI